LESTPKKENLGINQHVLQVSSLPVIVVGHEISYMIYHLKQF